MKKGKTPSVLTGISGVHHVVSEFSRRGMIALPTIRNTAGYDIIVASANGRKHANIQVKTTSNRPRFWMMPSSEKIRSGRNDWYVCLACAQKGGPYVGYMLSGVVTKREVQNQERKTLKSVRRGTRRDIGHSLHVDGRNKEKARRWAEKWETWRL